MGHRVLLADDHTVVRQGLKNLLLQEGFEVDAEAADGREAVEQCKALYPDIAVLDVSMPALNGIDAAQEIRAVSPRTKVIFLTMYKDEQYVLAALRAGIKAYVLKSQAAVDLVQAINSALNGELYLSPGISESVVKAAVGGQSALDPLTTREREVLQLIAEGKTNKEISQELGKSIKTVESHRTNIMTKLDIHQTAGLVRHALKIGLIQP